MTGRHLRVWSGVHTWTSLVSTLFLLVLCLTGLPLIFHEEIDTLLSNRQSPPIAKVGTPLPSLDDVVQAGLALYPGQTARFVIFDVEELDLVRVNIAPPAAGPRDPGTYHVVSVDARTASVLASEDGQGGLTAFLLRIHRDLLLGLPGELFLGGMGLLFAAAIVSGVVLYAPFTHKLEFGTVRRQRSRRIRWLDTHNLVGVATAAWCLVVGVTGSINTCAEILLGHWQATQFRAISNDAPAQVPPTRLASIETVLKRANEAVPGLTPSFIAYPGTLFSGPSSFTVYLHGDKPLTRQLLRPVQIDAETAAFIASPPLPWYLTVLLLSQPLHFGDYGGQPLKILWAIMDLLTIAILITGLYLWARRNKLFSRSAEITSGHDATAAARKAKA